MTARVIIAQPGGHLGERLLTAVLATGAVPVPVADLEVAFDTIQNSDTAVLLIGPDMVADVAFELASHLSTVGRTAVVLTAHEIDTGLMQRAMRSGVSDVLSIEDSVDDITASVTRALAASERMRSGSAPIEVAARERAEIITVFSTKGGVGKTVLSTNLAVALARDTGKRVALIDLDLEFGDVAIMLGIQPQHTIYDAVRVFDRLDDEMLAGFMEEHSSGIKVLLAPLRPEEAEGISAARVGQVIDLVRDNFDFVVIDTSPSFSEAVLAALDRSDQVYVITTMDVASIKNTRISMQKLRQLGYDNGKVQLVLNRSDSKVLLQPAEVEQAIGGRVSMHIPSDRIVPRSVNKGVPVVLEMPKSDVAKSITQLARGAAAAVDKEAGNVA